MYDIIVSNPNNDINYGKRTIKNIVQYLEMELANDTIGYEELVSEVTGQYKSMFPPRGGLSEFYIWDNSFEVRYRANHEYEQRGRKIFCVYGEKSSLIRTRYV